MNPDSPVPLHAAQAFVPRYFAPAPALPRLLGARPDQFFVVRIEDLYPLLRGPVPAVRSLAHSLLLVTSGQARMTIGYDDYAAGAGQLLLVPAGQVYSFQPHDLNTGFLCHVHPDLLRRLPPTGAVEPEFLTSWGQPLVELAPEAAAFVQVLLARLLALFEPASPAAATDALPYLAVLLAEIARAYRPLPGPAPSAAATLTRQFKQLLSQRVCHTHRVAVYAELLHITPNHLTKAVRTVTGKSPGRWIDEALVLEAKALLYQTDLPVAEVAARLGLHDPSYFSRLFRKLEGRPPSALRRPASPGA